MRPALQHLNASRHQPSCLRSSGREESKGGSAPLCYPGRWCRTRGRFCRTAVGPKGRTRMVTTTKKNRLAPVLFATALGVAATPAWALTPMLGYSGRLFDASGTPVTGAYAITFRIYDDPTDGELLFEESFAAGESVDVI